MNQAKKDALTIIRGAKEKCQKANWKTRQDLRTANEIYRYLCAAEHALELAQAEEAKNEPVVEEEMIPGDPNEEVSPNGSEPGNDQ